MRIETYTFRTLPDFEKAKIKGNWYHSYKMEWECKWMEPSVYKQYYNDIIDKVMSKDKVHYVCFYIRDLFVGWICYESDFLHYVYVKKMYRLDSSVFDFLRERCIEINPGKIDVTFFSYFIMKLLDRKCWDNKFRRFG